MPALVRKVNSEFAEGAERVMPLLLWAEAEAETACRSPCRLSSGIVALRIWRAEVTGFWLSVFTYVGYGEVRDGMFAPRLTKALFIAGLLALAALDCWNYCRLCYVGT
ncbi:hypothetical protein F4813DRAFT_345591 [Daldinia decipiens]|uniref:uncharacterized protein n=1 Tax=Daldinia decipiens TaxID=326647 RepID=UPI0020C314CB|nr:uncharacterized protein F4813DRAFT_345591 [Daldinia decipiens]KAI1661733.1 hypothetical protein F4813DRAFT_345591 [Daldinia decipiens]